MNAPDGSNDGTPLEQDHALESGEAPCPEGVEQQASAGVGGPVEPAAAAAPGGSLEPLAEHAPHAVGAANGGSATPAEPAVDGASLPPSAPETGERTGKETGEATEGGDDAVLRESRARTRRSFLGAAAAAAAGFGFYEYLSHGPQLQDQPALLRRTFDFNAALSNKLPTRGALAPTYPLERAETLRLNGFYGLKRTIVRDSWRLQLVGSAAPAEHPRYSRDVTAWQYLYSDDDELDARDRAQLAHVNPDVLPSLPPPNLPGDNQSEDDNRTGRKPRGFEEAGESNSTVPPQTPGLLLTLEDILKLPRRELVTQFKCIEGWSQIVHWAGVRLADFFDAFPPTPINGREPRFVYMETPDGDYYTGYDLAVLRHPQALLVTEMMGSALTPLHGAPLRLHLPTKYGYKQIKRIGLIAYTDEKPDDYWTKLGYDWYAGL